MNRVHGSDAALHGRRIASVLLSAAAILVGLELALQLRAEMLVGRSILDHITQTTRFAVDERTGLKLLRASSTFADPAVVIRTNSLGLRGPEIRPERTSGSLRIAVIGASTVMGLVAATDEHTFAFLLQSRLRRAFPERVIEVINGGIAGYRLKDERLILERLILPLKPDLVIVYTGVNEFQGYCAKDTPKQRGALPVIVLPEWLLTVRVIQEKTAALRSAPRLREDTRDPHAVDLGPYRADLEALARTVLESQSELVLVTNVRAYRPDQPPEEQQRLSATERRQSPCFDVAGLNVLYDLHNAAIQDVGRRMKIRVLPLHERIPGGERYFVDSAHLSFNGERLVADEIFGFLMAEKLVRF